MNPTEQLSLAIALDDQATFDNYYAPNGTPQHMATFLLKDDARKFAYFSGGSGTDYPICFRLFVKPLH